MINVQDPSIQKKIDQLYERGQQHILQFWEKLNSEQKEILLAQIRNLDFDLIDRLIELSRSADQQNRKDVTLEPVPIMTLEEREAKDHEVTPLGEDALRKGKVAAFLVAGGQGSRLGFEGPKGAYEITPVKNKPLFQLHAEKLRAMQKRYDITIPWYIMTSKTNHEETIRFFKENDHFGYDRNALMFFSQDMIPAIDFEGSFFLEKPYKIFESPNGHGGSIKALWDSGAIDDMKERGIEYIFYFQVDNVLTKICDPVYLGYHIVHHSEMSNKVLRKAYPEEKMGVICKINGKIGVREYSDLSEEEMYAKNEDGSLKFWAGSIAIHIINVNFIERENEGGFQLPYHIAKKKIKHINEKGEEITPEKENGIKFETFVFDALPDAQKTFSLEVKRSEEFSALKNKKGADSPKTTREDLLKTYARWLAAAGIQIPLNDEGVPEINLEISPVFALDEHDIIAKRQQLPEKFEDGTYLK